MSDRMTNVEIEDVLTSIRRLVMEGGAGPSPVVDRVSTVTSQVDEVETPVLTQGKFVLTPACRVADPVQLHPVVTPLWPAEMPAEMPADDPLPLDILPDADQSDAAIIAPSDLPILNRTSLPTRPMHPSPTAACGSPILSRGSRRQ